MPRLTPTTFAAVLAGSGLQAAAAALAEPMPILVAYPCGSLIRIEETFLAPFADVFRSLAQEGEEAVFQWCVPEHRPPVEDVELLPDGTLVLHLLSEAFAPA